MILVFLFSGFFLFAAEQTMYVGQKTVVVKQKASLFAKKVAALDYGTKVSVLSESGSWFKIQTSDNKSGWVKKNALTKKRLGGITEITTDTDSISLAGKGSENHARPADNSEDEEQDSVIEASNLGNEK